MSLSDHILDCLRGQGPAGTDTLAHRLGVADTRRVAMPLRALQRLGQIERREFGAWHLAEATPQQPSDPEPVAPGRAVRKPPPAPEPAPEPEPTPPPPPPPTIAPRHPPARQFLPTGHCRPASEFELWSRELQQAHRELTRAEDGQLKQMLTRWRTRGPGEPPTLPGASPAMQLAVRGRWEIEHSRWRQGLLRGRAVW